jgi:hypothetical protein
MRRRFYLMALLISLSQYAIAGDEDAKTRPNKEELSALTLEASRMSAQEQDNRLAQILRDQAGSKTPRSDFMFCTGLAYLGNYKAQRCVAYAYENGIGIVEDLTEAYTWYEIALGNNISDEADAQKAEEDRDRTRDRLVSAYPHPTEDELNDFVNAQKSRIAHYQEQLKKTPQ